MLEVAAETKGQKGVKKQAGKRDEFDIDRIGCLGSFFCDAAATTWALARAGSRTAESQRKLALELIRRGRSTDGGWGPFVNAPPESFDTAIVVPSLQARKDQTDVAPLIAAGRTILLAQQAADGSWPPTTRPPGADSYAQRLSTSAWATLALLATRSLDDKRN